MAPGQTVPNMVIARVANKKISIYNNAGSAQVLVDVLGYFRAARAAVRGDRPEPPARHAQRRRCADSEARPVRALVACAQQGRRADLERCRGDAQRDRSDTDAGHAFITIFPGGSTQPATSKVLNVLKGQVVPKMVVCRLSSDGTVDIANNAGDRSGRRCG